MVVGLATITLRLHCATSLKDKRRVVKSVTSRLRPKFNIAVAEIADHDSWGTATLGVVCVSNDARHAHSMLEKVVRAIDGGRFDADLVDYEVELL